MRPDTIFWLASNTKAIAAATLMTLVDDGKVNLDDPVAKYLPEFASVKVKAKDGMRPPARPITVRMALSHMSGLPFFPGMPIDKRSISELARLAAATPLNADPGEKYAYSNWGIDVAMAVVEKVTGRSFAAVMKERILVPLGMKDAVFVPSANQAARIAKSYQLGEGKPPKEIPIGQFSYPYTDAAREPEGGGGLFGTADDLCRFFKMLAADGKGPDGRRILSAAAVAEMTRRQTPNRPKIASYGFGLKVATKQVGHGGAYGTYAAFDPTTKTVRVLCISMTGSNARRKAFRAEWEKAVDDFLHRSGTLAAAQEPTMQPPDVSAATVLREGFTVRLKVDLDKVTANEELYVVGPARLALRLAGTDKSLAGYDDAHGNYLSYPLPDGTCPVIEATIAEKAGRVGIPLGFLKQAGGVHDVTLHFSPVKWAIAVDGHVDEDFPIPACPVQWPAFARRESLSPRVRAATFSVPALSDALPVETPRPVTRPIQYWTPDDHNRWVGDVAPGFFGGQLHVFYLVDRRHHGSGARTGRHQFAHLVTDDLVRWTELPLAVPIRETWQTVGTGTPFMKDGKLAIAFGWHTRRYKEMKAFPAGGTYATSADGVHFENCGIMVSEAQNPSIYNLPDGRYELVTSYGGSIGIFRSKDLLHWDLFDAKLPFRGDCPSLFDWHGHRYLLQGFTNMAYSPDGTTGSFVNWTAEPDKLYDGLGVPMVTKWKDDRRLYIGWLNHVHGWGGWLVFREVVAYPDGHLGLKWVPEIAPPVPPRTFQVEGGTKFERVFHPTAGGTALRFIVDPAAKTASFGDDVPNLAFGEARSGHNVRIGGVRGIDGDYAVRLIVYYDPKSRATIFDAEIAGQRTLICRRAGTFKID